MPYTMGPRSPQRTWHIWTEREVREWPKTQETGAFPLCGGGDPLGERPEDLVRLEDAAEEFTGPGPRSIPEWLLGSSSTTVCRECAERLVEELGLHLAPIQWVPQVGPKRTSKLKDAGVDSIHEVVKRYLTTDTSGSGPVYATGHLMDETGLSKGGARQVLNNVAMERWRRETEERGISWLIKEVRRDRAPHVS